MANPFEQFTSDDAPATKPASVLDRALAAENTPAPVADIARSVFQQETSSGKNVRTSNAGAVGPMQVIPTTFKQVADPGWDINNPDHNARAGVRYISQMYDKAGGDPALAAAGYYGGPGGLEKAKQGVAVRDPRNPGAPNTLQYGQQVASRLPAQQEGSQALTQQSSREPNPFAQFVNQDSEPAAGKEKPNPFAQFVTADQSALAPTADNAPRGLSMTTDINGNPLPQRTVSFLHGLMDPVAGASQLITKALPDSVNGAMTSTANWISDKTGGILPRMPEGGIDQEVRKREQAYEQGRAANGETGFDGYRVLGNVLNPVNLAPGGSITRLATLPERIAAGAATGAASSALAPVDSDNFASDKIKQVAAGTILGGIMPAIGAGIARLISPNTSKNVDLQLLKAEGVRPTIGQTLGGWANNLEEKLQILPIFGDGIAAARGRAREDFNKAAINRTLAPIGEQIDSAGHAGVREAGNKLSAAYDNLLGTMSLRPDQQLAADLSGIAASRNLRPQEADMFNALMRKHVSGFGQNGTMSGQDFKVLESTLNDQAKNFSGATDGYQRMLGGALEDALGSFRDALGRSNPNQAPLLNKINEGWANLVRVEGAAKSGINAKGVFTPAQLNGAVRGADTSVRDRATARGQALMQDLGDAGQAVLGNKVPDSGTAGRLVAGAGALASGGLSLGIPAALIGGAAMYTRPVQSMLSAAASARPAAAEPLAGAIARLAGGLSPMAAQAGVEVPHLGRKPGQRQGYADGGLIDDYDEDAQAAQAQSQYTMRMAKAQQADDEELRKENARTVRGNEKIALESMGEDTEALGYKNGGLIGDHRRNSAIRTLAFGNPTAVNPRPGNGKAKVPRIAA